MAQTLFAAATELSLPLVDANFSELYAAKNRIWNASYPVASYSIALFAGVGGGAGFGTTAMWTSNASRVTLSYGAGTYGLTIHTLETGTQRGVNFIQGGSADGVGTPTNVGSITTTTSSTAYNTTSDERLKTNIVDLPDAGAAIDAMQPRQFEFLVEPGVQRIGFIAQELYAVVPEAVTPGGDNQHTNPWQVDLSRLVPLLVRELQSLRARVAALEAP